MDDPAPQERGPLSPQDAVACGLLLVFILGLFAADVFTNFHPVKLSGLLVVLFWIPLLVLHEAGHALMAAGLGWYVGQIVIGMGRPISRFRIGNTAVEVRVAPFEGFVVSVPTNLNWPHLKSALIYFAGPGIELFLALILLWIVGPDHMFRRSDDYLLITLQSLALAAVAQGVLNLIPHAVWKNRREVANDGLGIIRSFMWPKSHFAEMIGHRFDDDKQEWRREDDAGEKSAE
ncbi:hypothetical protein AYO44_00150 [Planctomycetaceae bacterium SCGC AG-212-F19]|nr:hypothetical protein AYO44_00150 [Planctomycetaceae bacterium SCGC AG-212-F19]